MAIEEAVPLSLTGGLLLKRAKDGDIEAHAVLFRQYQAAVYTIARRIVGHDQDAEEILQETFIEVFRSLRSMRRNRSFEAWVRRIAARKAIDRLRREKLRRGAPLEEAVLAKRGSLGEGGPKVETRDAGLDLERALSMLPPIARAVVWLFDVEGFTHAEIAGLTGRSVSFSKSQLSRARARLRKCLAGEEDHRG